MKRTQVCFEDEIWRVLQIKARGERTTISALVRAAVREKYLDPSERRQAMLDVIGVWKDRTDLPDTGSYLRRLRKSSRLKRVR